jgi:hypothetical protein
VVQDSRNSTTVYQKSDNWDAGRIDRILATRMSRVQQFQSLPADQRQLLLRAVGLVAPARIALWTWPFGWVRLVVGARRGVWPEMAAIRVTLAAQLWRIGKPPSENGVLVAGGQEFARPMAQWHTFEHHCLEG